MTERDVEIEMRLARLENMMGIMVSAIDALTGGGMNTTAGNIRDHWQQMAMDIRAAIPSSRVCS